MNDSRRKERKNLSNILDIKFPARNPGDNLEETMATKLKMTSNNKTLCLRWIIKMVNGRSGTILGILRPQGTIKKKSVGAWNDFQLKSQTIAPIPRVTTYGKICNSMKSLLQRPAESDRRIMVCTHTTPVIGGWGEGRGRISKKWKIWVGKIL